MTMIKLSNDILLGVSARCSRSWALVGDLTAMYDSNALALLPQLDRGTRVLGVINNGGDVYKRQEGKREKARKALPARGKNTGKITPPYFPSLTVLNRKDVYKRQFTS